ncbi:MAG: c-type cytochrome [Actinobacteria bacterium]|nr:c-type cytochrome [Actinomycetota bacterium]
MSRRLQEGRAQHQRYKEDVEKRGKSFYPYAMFHDTVMSLVVVAVIVALACIWYLTAEVNEDGSSGSGALGVLYEDKADPGTTSFIPRPDWYFYFLFYLLRIFKWPDSVILGTVGIPTIALILLLALPFIDLRRERRLVRRPVAVVAVILTALSMGVLTYKGAVAEEGSEATGLVPEWIERFSIPPGDASEGAEIFSVSGCLNCHQYAGEGVPNLGAPELTEEGNKNRGVQWQIDHLECPSCVTPGSPMPPYEDLGQDNLRKLAAFLEASKGEAAGGEAAG